MRRFLCWGWISGHEYVWYENDYRFFACVFAHSLREAHSLACSLAPAECNHVSVICLA
jgi:hypothetical protein